MKNLFLLSLLLLVGCAYTRPADADPKIAKQCENDFYTETIVNSAAILFLLPPGNTGTMQEYVNACIWKAKQP